MSFFLTSESSPSNSEDTSPATSPGSGVQSVDDSESANRSWGRTTLVPEGTYDDRYDEDVRKASKNRDVVRHDTIHLHPLSPLSRGASELIQQAPSPTLANGDDDDDGGDDFLFGVDARLDRERAQESSSPVTSMASGSSSELRLSSSATSSILSSRSSIRRRTSSLRRVTIGGPIAPPTPPFTPTHRRVLSSISSLSSTLSSPTPLAIPPPRIREFETPPAPIAPAAEPSQLPLPRPSTDKPEEKARTHHRRRSSGVRRASGRVRVRQKVQEEGISRDFFLIIGLCVGLACACVLVLRPAVMAAVGYGTLGGVLELE
ncbi:unnamed protein product [Cyclocybe aegerita]|uniref:Uncharacterized protein n=1 Tax=Cyclocybe aegerita TaxID=1973307 RepID=A0A8S0WA94_CYCAE|nr:unnamed protein product [Cyclocybe aegerita]